MGTESHYPVSLVPDFAEPLLSIGSPSVCPLSPLGDPSPGVTSHTGVFSQGHGVERENVHAGGDSYRHHGIAISVLSDNVFLEIFDFCQTTHDTLRLVWKWHLLAHVCQRWRQIVLASPHRLNLRILCTYGTPVRKNLGIWPAFPIVVDYHDTYSKNGITPDDEDNVVAALEHPDRVSYLALNVSSLHLDKMVKMMQEPFPVLTHLHIDSIDRNAPVLPGGFLGGSAPRLRKITISGIPYPALPTLLLSTSDLVELDLRKIPPTRYISPQAMVAGLAASPRLEIFIIEFQSATSSSRPDRINPPPVTRTVLPSLTFFQFRGASEYLEDLVARIESPRLGRVLIVYLNQLVDFQVTQLSKLIDRSVGPKLTPFKRAHVTFFGDKVTFHMYPRPNDLSWDWRSLTTTISSEGIDWQVSHIAQVLSHFSATLSDVVHLKLKAHPEEGRQLERADDVEWQHLLRQFSTVQSLHVSHELAGHVALALEDITGEMVTDALPSLHSICLAGLPASSVEQFVAACRLSGRPITVIDTKTLNQRHKHQEKPPALAKLKRP